MINGSPLSSIKFMFILCSSLSFSVSVSVLFAKFLKHISVLFATPCSNVGPFTQLQGTARHYDWLRDDAFGFSWGFLCCHLVAVRFGFLLPAKWLVGKIVSTWMSECVWFNDPLDVTTTHSRRLLHLYWPLKMNQQNTKSPETYKINTERVPYLTHKNTKPRFGIHFTVSTRKCSRRYPYNPTACMRLKWPCVAVSLL